MPDGYVVRGHRHDGAIHTASRMTRYSRADVHIAKQGFVTSLGRFVDRTEGARLMREAEWHNPDTGLFFVGNVLFSEDLY